MRRRIWENSLSRCVCTRETSSENRPSRSKNTGEDLSCLHTRHYQRLTRPHESSPAVVGHRRYGFQIEERSGGERRSSGTSVGRPTTPPVTSPSAAASAPASTRPSRSPPRRVGVHLRSKRNLAARQKSEKPWKEASALVRSSSRHGFSFWRMIEQNVSADSLRNYRIRREASRSRVNHLRRAPCSIRPGPSACHRGRARAPLNANEPASRAIFNQLLVFLRSVVHLGFNAGQTWLCTHKHLQRAAPHAQLHHGKQSTYASKSSAVIIHRRECLKLYI